MLELASGRPHDEEDEHCYQPLEGSKNGWFIWLCNSIRPSELSGQFCKCRVGSACDQIHTGPKIMGTLPLIVGQSLG